MIYLKSMFLFKSFLRIKKNIIYHILGILFFNNKKIYFFKQNLSLSIVSFIIPKFRAFENLKIGLQR